MIVGRITMVWSKMSNPGVSPDGGILPGFFIILSKEVCCMEFVTGEIKPQSMDLRIFKACDGGDAPVCVEGAVHSIRNMGELAFIILRRECGLIQTVWEDQKTNMDIARIHDGDYIRVEGTVRLEPRAVHGREVRIRAITVLSSHFFKKYS